MNYRRRVARVAVMPMPILGHFISLLITGYNLQVYIGLYVFNSDWFDSNWPLRLLHWRKTL